MKWLEPAIDRPLPIFLATFLLVVLGIYSLTQLPIKRSPEIEVPYSFILVPYPGATPEEIEAEVNVELEEQLGSLDALRHMSTVASGSFGTVFLEFEDRTDMDDALQRVRDRTDRAEAEFPEEAESAVVMELSLENLPIIMFTLNGGGDLYRLREIAEEIKPSLESVSGVNVVEIFGGFEPEVRIHAEPAVLAQHGLTLLDLADKVRSQSRNIPTGEIATAGRNETLRATGEFQDLEEIRSLVVASEPAGPITLRDVAQVELAHERVTTSAFIDGEPSVTLIVRRRAKINTLETVRVLKERMVELQEALPPGISMQVTSDASKEIGDMLRQLGTSAAWGMLLVVGVLLAVFGVRQALLVAFVLPFSLLFALIGIYVFDISISNIVLFGMILVLGLVVDGAIIVGEAIFAEREEGADPREASKRGLARVGLPVIAADLTTIAAYMPLMLMVGIMGQFMSVLPRVVIFALAGSVFIDHLFLPAAAARISRSGKGRQQGPQFKWFRDRYLLLLDWALSRRRRVIFASTVAFFAAMSLFATGAVRSIFLPTADHSRFSIDYALPEGTRLEETNRVGMMISNEIRGLPEVTRYVMTTGDTGALNSAPQEGSRFGPEYGKISVELRKPQDRTRSQTEIVEAVREIVSGYSGVKIAVEELSEGPPVGSAVSLRLRGDDLDELSGVARQLERSLAALPSAVDPRVDYQRGKPQVRVELDRARASSQYGIDPRQVSMTLLTAFRGDKVGRMWVNGDRVDIRLQAPDQLAYTVDSVRELPLRSRDGELVPIGAVAEIDLDFTHSKIFRRDGERSVHVEADAAAGASSIELDAQVHEIVAGMALPSSVDVVFGGEAEERARSYRSLWTSLFWGASMIYIIIAIQFNSLRQPFVVLSAIPLSLVGVAVGLWVTGHPFSFNAFIGVVSLTGIVVNDAIVMVDAINQARREGLSLRDALLDAARRRFRPVVLTTVTTIAGLLVASILTLVVVPVVYSLLERPKSSRAPVVETLETADVPTPRLGGPVETADLSSPTA
jgi:multidrug efflux pump